MSDFQVAGIASGFDWTSMIDQLMEIERIPQQRLLTEQSTNETKLDAFSTLSTKLSTLQSKASAFDSSALFNAKAAAMADESLGINASVTTAANAGKFEINVSQLATTTKRFGTSNVGGSMGDESTVLTNLHLATDITEGTFTVNGQEVTVSETDTLQDVFDAISAATGGVVSASYDSTNDTISLSSLSGELELGSDDDSSNFLTAMKLDQLEVVDAGGGVSEVTSKSALGVVDLDTTIAESGLGGLSGTGTITINGVSIDFDADNESVRSLMQKVNSSKAGVTMSYDTAADQFRIVNKETGSFSMPVIDSGNGLLSAMGLTGAANVGQDMLYSIDGGATVSSRSNTISSEDHGMTGVTITATEEGTQTVTVSRDSTDLKTAINSFISAYNDVQDYIQEKTKITVEDDEVTAATLAGNREISSLDSQLRSLAFKSIDGMTGDLFRLEHLGIDFISGTSKLEIKDSDALEEALANDLDTLEEMFMGDSETSFSARLDTFIENFTKSNGVLDIQQDNLTARNKAIDAQIEEMERRLVFRQEALEAAFIAMEEAQQNINNQANALSALSTS